MHSTPWRRTRVVLLALCLGSALSLSGVAAFVSGLINVDIDAGSTPSVYTGAAATGSPGDFWNTVPVFALAPIALRTSDGLLSEVTLRQPLYQSGNLQFGALGFSGGSSPMALGPYGALMGDGMSSGGREPMVVTLNGLTADADYEIFAYSYGDNDGSGTRVSAAASVGTVLYVAGLSDLVLGQSYTHLPSVRANAAGSVAISMARVGGPLSARLNGFQIRAIPEPASALFGVALCVSVGVRRGRGCGR